MPPEKLSSQPLEIKDMNYEQFVEMRKKLRKAGRPPIAYTPHSGGYSGAIEIQTAIEAYGLEANPNQALGGVTIFVDCEGETGPADFEKLQKFIQENPQYPVKFPRIS